MSMSHINYNHCITSGMSTKKVLWLAQRRRLFNTTNHYRADPGAGRAPARKLFKRKGRGLEPSELGELVYAMPIKCSP